MSEGIRGMRRSLSLIPKKSLNPNGQTSNRILINVGGIHYETYRSTLKNIPDTRLAWLTEPSSQATADYDTATGEYFFDRHPGLFNMILNYYRTGKLHVPTDVCGPLFEEELAFWGIEEDQIESCCWTTYRSHRDAQETLKELNIENENSDDEANEEEDRYIAANYGIEVAKAVDERTWWQRWQPRMWIFLEEANSSKRARAIAIISMLFVLLSITTFCLESHIKFRVPLNESDQISENWTTFEKNTKSKPIQALVLLDYICIIFFTIEFIIRLIFAPNKRRFFCVVMHWIEIGAIVPFFIEKIIISAVPHVRYTSNIEILRSFRLIRIFRILKLTRHFSGLKILWKAIKASAKELLLLILFLFISVLIFACMVYYAESVDEASVNDFKNIPLGFWWAVVTMTTLGYGDMYPRTGLGYVVGVICSVAGVLVLALPVPVIVNNFSLYYSHAQAQMKLPKKQKRILAGVPDDLKVEFPISDIAEETGADQESETGNVRTEMGSGDRTLSDDSAIGSMESDKDLSEIAVPGRNKSRSGISVQFIDETTSPNCPSKIGMRRKISPKISNGDIISERRSVRRPATGKVSPEIDATKEQRPLGPTKPGEIDATKEQRPLGPTNVTENNIHKKPQCPSHSRRGSFMVTSKSEEKIEMSKKKSENSDQGTEDRPPSVESMPQLKSWRRTPSINKVSSGNAWPSEETCSTDLSHMDSTSDGT